MYRVSVKYLPLHQRRYTDRQKVSGSCFFPDVSSALPHTLSHPFRHPADQVVQRLGAVTQPHLSQVPDESVLTGRWFHLAELVLHDSPEVFNW